MAIDSKVIADSYQIQMPAADTVHMDPGYFDSVIAGEGVLFSHYRAIPCPVGLTGTDPYDIRKTHDDHQGCSQGFIYDYVGDARLVFSANQSANQLLDMGLLDGSTAQVTVPRYYENKPTEHILLMPFDRLYICNYKTLVVNFEKIEHNISGLDKTKFPAVSIEFCMDSDGKRYYQDLDFTVNNGQIRWNMGKQPGMDPASGKGVILAIRYRYIPFFYVSRLMHEVRIHTVTNPETGSLEVARMPYAALIQREYVFQNEQNDPRAIKSKADSPRKMDGPSSGSFGAR